MDRPRIGVTSSSGDGTFSRIEKVGRGYLDALVAAGGLPVVLATLPGELASAVLDGVDALVLPGGGDVEPSRYGAAPEPETGGIDPARDEWELALVAEARRRGTPILAICRGAQVVNVAFGGTLVQHLPTRTDGEHDDLDRADDEVHELVVAEGSLLAEVLGTVALAANTLHHQSVDVVGGGLVVSAVADDGVVEAVESRAERVLGVQWHPELLAERDPHRRLFAWVVAAASASA